MNSNGGEQRNLTKDSRTDLNPSWSPDGRSIAFHSYRDGNYEIYVMDANGNNQRRLTYNGAYDEQPIWSPDGRSIAFISKRDGNFEIYVMDADGNNQRRLTYNGAKDAEPSWSPNGRSIAFHSIRDGNWGDLRDGSIRSITLSPSKENYLRFSIEGNRVEYSVCPNWAGWKEIVIQ